MQDTNTVPMSKVALILATHSDFRFDLADEVLGRTVQRLSKFEDGREAGLLLTQFQNAYIGSAQFSFEAKFLLG